jgi:uncharacterized membrane protein
VRLDLAERLVYRAGAPALLRRVSAVRVQRAITRWSIAIDHEDGSRTRLIEGLPSLRRAEIAAAAQRIADLLEVEARMPSALTKPEMDRNTAAALCYLPIDGVVLVIAIYFLATSRDRFVRFAAKQSLAHLAITTAVLLALLGCCGLPIAALDLPGVIDASLLVLFVGTFAIARVGTFVYAAYRAQRGEAWVMPWLAPMSRRWLPAQK